MGRKRGALELSINTIVIVVIAVTLLTLGLYFVRGIFGNLTEISEETFGKSSTIIDSLNIDTKISSPSSISVSQGKTKTFKVLVGHDGTLSGQKSFRIQLKPNIPSGLNGKVEARIISEPQINLDEGEQASFVIEVATTTDAPLSAGLGRTPSYSLTVLANNEVYATSAFVIEIEKGRGIF
jgi:hypothetical protein